MDKTIMIVDDSRTIRSSVEYILSETEYEVICAENGRDAIDKFDVTYSNGSSISMVICDVNMPVMDGVTLIKKLKKSDKYKYIPILVLTTESDSAKKAEVREAGACGWLMKPFGAEQLIEVIKKFVK